MSSTMVTVGGNDRVIIHEIDIRGEDTCSWIVEESEGKYPTFVPRRWNKVAQDWVGFPREEGVVYFLSMERVVAFITLYEFGEQNP